MSEHSAMSPSSPEPDPPDQLASDDIDPHGLWLTQIGDQLDNTEPVYGILPADDEVLAGITSIGKKAGLDYHHINQIVGQLVAGRAQLCLPTDIPQSEKEMWCEEEQTRLITTFTTLDLIQSNHDKINQYRTDHPGTNWRQAAGQNKPTELYNFMYQKFYPDEAYNQKHFLKVRRYCNDLLSQLYEVKYCHDPWNPHKLPPKHYVFGPQFAIKALDYGFLSPEEFYRIRDHEERLYLLEEKGHAINNSPHLNDNQPFDYTKS